MQALDGRRGITRVIGCPLRKRCRLILILFTPFNRLMKDKRHLRAGVVRRHQSDAENCRTKARREVIVPPERFTVMT